MATEIVVALAGVLALGIAAQWVAWRLDLPAILLMLTFGVLAGPVLGLIEPDALFGDLLLPLVSLSVAVILFEGGLSLRISELRRNGGVILRLVTVGVVITGSLAAAAAAWVLGMPPAVAVITGAVLVVSGPTVVGPLLRTVRPKGDVGPILKWEGIVIDPIGATVAVLVFEAILAGGFEEATAVVATVVLKTLLIGLAAGVVAAYLLVTALRRYWVPDFLHNAVALMLVLLAFVGTNLVQDESGLLAVTIMGVALANQKRASIKHIIEFKETLRVLIIPGLFIILAARLTMDDIRGVGIPELAFLGILVLLVRPLSVLVSTIDSGLKGRERAFLAAVMPRGIVAAAISSVFALSLAEHGIEGANRIVPVTFLVITGTVLIYGITAKPAARLLGVAEAATTGCLVGGAHWWARDIARVLADNGIRVLMVDTNAHNVRAAIREGLPAANASMLSEEAMEGLDLEGLGRLFALTPNPEVNTLAALHFTHVFGREEVYQLASVERTEAHIGEVPIHLRGRLLFGKEITYETINDRFRQGARLEVETVHDAGAARRPATVSDDEPMPLFLFKQDGTMLIYTADSSPTPAEGDRLVSLGAIGPGSQ